MFLNELNKTEAIAFMNLVGNFAQIDNEFAREEKELVKEYEKELGLNSSDMEKLSLEEIITALKNSSERVRKIIYFELVGLALIDSKYEEAEIDFLDNLAQEFQIPRVSKIRIANYFYNFTEVYKFATVESEDKIKLLKEQAEDIIN